MITDIGCVLPVEDNRSTTTKSSMTPEKTRIALAKMAGISSGSMTRRSVCRCVQPRSAEASSYCLPIVTSRACTTMAGQLRFQLTRPSTSASVPSPTPRSPGIWVKMKYSATPKISSGTTNDKIIRKLNPPGILPRHLLMPSAKATPIGTAITVVSAESLSVWKIALCSCGLYQIELTLSPQYQRSDRPWNADWDLPLLNENSTAIAMGASDQTRYSQVKPSRNHGCRHGL